MGGPWHGRRGRRSVGALGGRLHGESGASVIEFGLLIAMLSLTTVTGASALSSGLAATFADVGATVSVSSPVGATLLPISVDAPPR